MACCQTSGNPLGKPMMGSHLTHCCITGAPSKWQICTTNMTTSRGPFNSLRLRLNRHPFADDIFKCIFLNENERILPRISLKFVLKVPINNIPTLIQIMAWRRPGDKPLSEPMMVSLLTHICVTRPQWVKLHGLTVIPAWKSNHVLGKLWDEFTYPFPTWKGEFFFSITLFLHYHNNRQH